MEERGFRLVIQRMGREDPMKSLASSFLCQPTIAKLSSQGFDVFLLSQRLGGNIHLGADELQFRRPRLCSQTFD